MMQDMRRRLLPWLLALSLLPLFLVALFWFRTGTTTDVLMLPLPAQRQLILTSHWGGWLEWTLIDNYPEAKWGCWSGPRWKNVGPFKFWQIHHNNIVFFRQIWTMAGQLALPRATPHGPIAYEQSYARAEALDFATGIPAGSPDWIIFKATGAKIPFPLLFLATILLPLPFAFLLLRRRWITRRRFRANLCLHCGYDLRATPDRCPECGHSAPSTAPAIPFHRRLFAVVSPLSLLLLLAFAVLWLRCQRVADQFEFGVKGSNSAFALLSFRGGLALGRYHVAPPLPSSFRHALFSPTTLNDHLTNADWTLLGFAYVHRTLNNYHFWKLTIPHWPVLLGILTRQFLRRRRPFPSSPSPSS